MFTLSGLPLVGLALGMSNFAVAIGIGMGGVDVQTRVKMALIFGFFEALMPIIGLAIGQAVAGLLGEIGRYVGAALLVCTGAYTVARRMDSSAHLPVFCERTRPTGIPPARASGGLRRYTAEA